MVVCVTRLQIIDIEQAELNIRLNVDLKLSLLKVDINHHNDSTVQIILDHYDLSYDDFHRSG